MAVGFIAIVVMVAVFGIVFVDYKQQHGRGGCN